MKNLFLARPTYGPSEPEADYAATHCVADNCGINIHIHSYRCSMTAKNCNDHLKSCLNAGIFHYFAMQHADVSPEENWASTLVRELELHDYDVIHAPCRIKNRSGETSTAVAYTDTIYGMFRRMTVKELAELPKTFDIDVLKELYDSEAKRLFINTGCMVVKLGDWVEEFPGFTMYDKLRKGSDGVWEAYCMSEDYMFAHWCNENGLRLGAHQLVTKHWGREGYSSDELCGQEHHAAYLADKKMLEEAAL